MTKSIRKSFRREIKGSFARFLSILLIVSLGVAFFSGIRSASPAMKKSADLTYDSQNFMDLTVRSTLGMTQDDLEAIAGIAGVSDVEGAFQKDYICAANGSNIVTTVLSLTDRINIFKVSEGRYPEVYDECLVDEQFINNSGCRIGDTISLTTGTTQDIEEQLKSTTYTIVGVGSTAEYLNEERGTTEIGDGTVDGLLIIPQQAFSLKQYTRLFVRVDGAAGLNCFSRRYDRTIENVKSSIQSISEERCNIRYNDFRYEANELISEAEDKFLQRKQTAIDELESSYQQLSDAQTVLDVSKAELDSKRQMLEDAKTLLDGQELNLPDSEEMIATAKTTLAELRSRFETTKTQLTQANRAISAAEEELRQNAATMTTAEYADAAFNIYSYKALAQLYESQLDAIEISISSAEQRIANAEAIMNGDPNAISDTRAKLLEGDKALNDAQKELDESQKKLDEAKANYEQSKQDMTTELERAENQLDKYKQEIAETPVPTWYVTDRSAVESYASFKNDADGIAAVGLIFPIVFFLVAALVSLTTMTRMVEEQRTQIGTYKALGYTRKEIAQKYISYALLATVLGSVLGAVVGEFTIPTLVVTTYKSVYLYLLKTSISFNFIYAFIAMALAVICTVGAVLLVLKKVLRSGPAALMIPEPPKAGKKIFLEKFQNFWLRLNFSQKAALRNLFRYKKRLYMSLFGVAGCMALLIVGFGINDSVSSMTDKQFDKVWNYQGFATIDEALTTAERRTTLSEISSISGVSEYMQARRELSFVNSNAGTQQNAYIIVPQNVDQLSSFVRMQSRFPVHQYLPNDQGVVITEKLAKLLDVKLGQTITFKSSEEGTASAQVTVVGIVENYVYHYVYMTPAMYKTLFGESAVLNTIMIKTGEIDPDVIEESLSSIDGITSVSMNNTQREKIDKTTDNLILIVALMIVSAALLAFVVLYNLNNINIEERKRELATLKVLGFYNKDLNKYIFRENAIITFMGIIIGLVIGLVLHFVIMLSVETDMMMFGRSIKWYSVIISIILTILFTVIVDRIMSKKLTKINMVEALKSGE